MGRTRYSFSKRFFLTKVSFLQGSYKVILLCGFCFKMWRNLKIWENVKEDYYVRHERLLHFIICRRITKEHYKWVPCILWWRPGEINGPDFCTVADHSYSRFWCCCKLSQLLPIQFQIDRLHTNRFPTTNIQSIVFLEHPLLSICCIGCKAGDSPQ